MKKESSPVAVEDKYVQRFPVKRPGFLHLINLRSRKQTVA